VIEPRGENDDARDGVQDDYARVTIAQSFAHAPRLDPSGTSWLPFPFWWMGTFLALLGRSLTVARIASIVLASLAAALPYAALRIASVDRARALGGTAFALVTPWMLWLGGATVPESFTATASASAIIVLAARPSAPFAALLACACLSRYEAWPVAAVAAVALIARDRSRRSLGIAAFCAAAPILWMLWNAHAHGSPVHFFHRVSSFKRAIGAGSTSTSEAVLFYPRLLATTRPEVVVATLAGLYALRDAALRKRWLVPLGAALAQIVFLAAGNARDGAPAHHPERALVGVLVLLALFGVDACASLAPRLRLASLSVAGLLWAFSARAFADAPGRSPSEDRRAQIARGDGLRTQTPEGFTLSPCSYEHFALIAAYGAPERVVTLPPRGVPVDPSCPEIREARGSP
jgi:hypothetical protein